MENEVRLLKTDRNAVLLLIQEAHLDPSEFQWQSVTASDHTQGYDDDFLMSRLIHMPTYQFGHYNEGNHFGGWKGARGEAEACEGIGAGGHGSVRSIPMD
jgi:hypothetical protein